MAAKINWHRYGTKLRHCHPVYFVAVVHDADYNCLTHARRRGNRMLSTGIIVLIVLMVLCAVLGSIYAYLYLTRINPQCLRRLHGPPKHRGPYSDPGGSNMDDDATNVSSTSNPSTHIFLFRK